MKIFDWFKNQPKKWKEFFYGGLLVHAVVIFLNGNIHLPKTITSASMGRFLGEIVGALLLPLSLIVLSLLVSVTINFFSDNKKFFLYFSIIFLGTSLFFLYGPFINFIK